MSTTRKKLVIEAHGKDVSAGRTLTGIKKPVGTLGGSFAGLGAGIAGAFAVGAIVNKFKQLIGGAIKIVVGGIGKIRDLTKASLESADILAKTSDKLGISIDKLAALQFAGEQTGVSINKMNTSLEKMVKNISEAASGTGEAKDTLEDLGLSAEKLNQMSPDEQFLEVAEAMKNVKLQSDRVRFAYEIFGRSGVALVNTLKAGKEGLKDFEAEARQMGLTMRRIDAKEIEKANDAVNKLSKLATGIGNKFAIAFAPLIEDLADFASDEGPQIILFFQSLASELAIIGQEVGAIAKEMLKIVGIDTSRLTGGVKARTRSELIDVRERIREIEGVQGAGITDIESNVRRGLSFVGITPSLKEELADLKRREAQAQRVLKKIGLSDATFENVVAQRSEEQKRDDAARGLLTRIGQGLSGAFARTPTAPTTFGKKFNLNQQGLAGFGSFLSQIGTAATAGGGIQFRGDPDRLSLQDLVDQDLFFGEQGGAPAGRAPDRGFQFLESRFLTRAPGARLDPQKQTADSTKEISQKADTTNDWLEKVRDKLDELIGVTEPEEVRSIP